MNLRKRDFQRVVHDIKEFLTKLQGTETAELRDSLNYSLLNLHKHYKRIRHKTKVAPLLDGSLSLSSSLGSLSPASPFIPPANKFDWRWINLDANQLSASFGHGDKRNFLPEVFHVLREADIERLQELIKLDGDCINEVDVLGRCTVSYCIHGNTKEHLHCLDILIQNGVDLQHEANDGLQPIHICALCNNEKALDRLLKKKVSLNVEDSEGRFPLHLAAAYADKSLVKKLLDGGGDKNSLDNDEMTPVMWACHFDQYENMELLLNISHDDDMRFEIIDAEMRDKDKSGKNLLHWCCSRSTSKQCFKVLMRSEYIYIVDNHGKTIIHHIAENGSVGALEELLEICQHDVSLNVSDHQGRTPLHLACIGGHGELVDILLNRGASTNTADNNGHTSFDYAKQKNLNYCLLVILSHLKFRNKPLNTNNKKNHKAPDTWQQQTDSRNQAKNSNDLTVTNNRDVRDKLPDTRQSAKTLNTLNINKAEDTRQRSKSPRRAGDAVLDKGLSNKSTKIVANDKRQKLTRQDDVTPKESKKLSPNNLRSNNIQDDHHSDDDEDHAHGGFDASTFDIPQGDLEKLRQSHTTDSVEGASQKALTLNQQDAITKIQASVTNQQPTLTRNNQQTSDYSNSLSSDEGSDYNFNDQLVVLVQHQGSDDELVIDVDAADNSKSSFGDGVDGVPDDDEEDLLDIPFARNGSITTVGVVSEGSMAFNSASVDPSVSSLVNSSSIDDNGKSLPPSSRRSPSNSKNNKSPLPPGPTKADYSPRLPASDLTAPMPPPSHYYGNQQPQHPQYQHGSHSPVPADNYRHQYGGDTEHQDINADVLVIDSGEDGDAGDSKNITMARPKTSKGRRNQNEQRPTTRDSWPPPKSTPQNRHQDDEAPKQQKTSPRISSSLRLAPISVASLPKPPSYRYDS